MFALSLTRLLVKPNIPGRFLLSELASSLLTSNKGVFKGNIGRYQVYLDFSDQVQRQVYFRLYDIEGIAMTKRLLKSGDTFLDIGSNIGYYSLVASQLVGVTGRVHAFEPIPTNIDVLRTSIAENSITNIEVNQLAISDKAGVMEIYLGGDNVGNSGWASFVKSERRDHSLQVEVVTVDDYIKDHAVNQIKLVKLDIEGAELNALKGMKNLCTDKNAPYIICEINPYLLERQGLNSISITACLAEYGYTIYILDNMRGGPVDPSVSISALKNIFCTKGKFLQ